MRLLFTKRYRAFAAEESGSELVEFALTCVVLFMLVFGVIECSLALYANHFVSYAASEGARYAMVRGTTWAGTSCSSPTTALCQADKNSVTAYVQSLIPGGITGTVTPTVTWSPLPGGSGCSVPDPGCVVTVKVKYPFTLQIPFVPVQVINLESTAAMVVSQ